MSATPWPDDKEALLRKLWDEKATAREIADALSTPRWSVSRNAVLGKVHRLGLAMHRPPSAEPKPRKAVVNKPKRRDRPFMVLRPIPRFEMAKRLEPLREFLAKPELPEPEPLNLTLMDLTPCTCKWPVSGEGAATLFCGAGKEPGPAPYCDYHTDKATGIGTLSERRAGHSEGRLYT